MVFSCFVFIWVQWGKMPKQFHDRLLRNGDMYLSWRENKKTEEKNMACFFAFKYGQIINYSSNFESLHEATSSDYKLGYLEADNCTYYLKINSNINDGVVDFAAPKRKMKIKFSREDVQSFNGTSDSLHAIVTIYKIKKNIESNNVQKFSNTYDASVFIVLKNINPKME